MIKNFFIDVTLIFRNNGLFLEIFLMTVPALLHLYESTGCIIFLSGRWFCSFCDVMLLGLYFIQFKQFFFWPLHVTKGNHSVLSFFSSQDRFSSQHKMQAFPTNFLVCPLKENILTKKLGEKAFVLRGDLQCSWRYWEQKQSILMMLSAFISALRFPTYIRYVSFNWLFKSLWW